MLLIKNANVLAMTGEDEQLLDILMDKGVFVKIGNIDENEYPMANVIDAHKRLVTPGLVDAHCHVGMQEDATRVEGDDVNEMSDPIVPQVRGIDSIKPQDPSFKEAMEAGITSVVTGPGSGEVICGTFCALKTSGKTVVDMCIVEEVAMKMALGENPKRCFGSQGKAPKTRMGSAALMREYLTKAKKYNEKKQKYIQAQKLNDDTVKEPEYDIRLESLGRVFEGMPVKIHAHQQDDIVTAMRIAKEFSLNATIEHCTEGYLIADFLKENNQGIIIGPTLGTRSKIELKNKTFDAGRVYIDNNIKFALMTDHPVIPLQNALTQAAIYVKHGVPAKEMLKALTINAAELAHISHRVGSIEIGKDADLVIWSQDPFHYMAEATVVVINGEVVRDVEIWNSNT